MKVFFGTCPLCCGDVGSAWPLSRTPVCTFCGASLNVDTSTPRRRPELAAPNVGLVPKRATLVSGPRLGAKAEVWRRAG